MKFRFRLEPLLGVRRLKEDLARRDLAAAHREVVAQNERLAALLREERAGRDAVRKARQGAIDPARARLQGEGLAALERRAGREFERLQELSRTEAAKRGALGDAMKEVRILEKLRGRQEQAHRLEEGRGEQRTLDEVAQNLGRETGS